MAENTLYPIVEHSSRIGSHDRYDDAMGNRIY